MSVNNYAIVCYGPSGFTSPSRQITENCLKHITTTLFPIPPIQHSKLPYHTSHDTS